VFSATATEKKKQQIVDDFLVLLQARGVDAKGCGRKRSVEDNMGTSPSLARSGKDSFSLVFLCS